MRDDKEVDESGGEWVFGTKSKKWGVDFSPKTDEVSVNDVVLGLSADIDKAKGFLHSIQDPGPPPPPAPPATPNL